jgi:hypothetical protein
MVNAALLPTQLPPGGDGKDIFRPMRRCVDNRSPWCLIFKCLLLEDVGKYIQFSYQLYYLVEHLNSFTSYISFIP